MKMELEQARQLFLQVHERTIDCNDWDVEERLKDLNDTKNRVRPSYVIEIM